MEVSLAELKVDIEKYIDMVGTQDILITKEGREIAKLSKTKTEEEEIAEREATLHEFFLAHQKAKAEAKTEEEIIALRVAAMKAVAGIARTRKEIDIDRLRMEKHL
jgi:antitoxin (DNA-binding transcriptional repressor) of toxin-antitoxin stability system